MSSTYEDEGPIPGNVLRPSINRVHENHKTKHLFTTLAYRGESAKEMSVDM